MVIGPSPSSSGLRRCVVAGERQEDVVEARAVESRPSPRVPRRPRAGRACRRTSSAVPPVATSMRAQPLVAAGTVADSPSARSVGWRGRRTAAAPSPRRGSALSSSGGAAGDDAAPIEQGDRVGELVGLLEVLRGEQDGDALVDEAADGAPQLLATARVKPGGRLVEEQQPGRLIMLIARSSRRFMPAGVGPGPAVAGVGRDRSRASSSCGPGPGRTPRTGAAAGPSSRGSPRPVSMSSTAAYWPVRLIERLTPTGSVSRSWPAIVAVPASGRTRVARIRTIVVLPAPLGPSSARTEPVSRARST